jgi:hypothetical protein
MDQEVFEMNSELPLPRCPHCSVARPRLDRVFGPLDSVDFQGHNQRWWSLYRCKSCGGMILAESDNQAGVISHMYPSSIAVDDSIPEMARKYLRQAIESLHAPAGAVMLAASSVDAMLKAKGLKEGTLNSRIDKAAEEHLITSEMAAWAHEVRLEANDQRHADEMAELPNEVDARRAVSFTLALAEFLFSLPAKVERGRKTSTK